MQINKNKIIATSILILALLILGVLSGCFPNSNNGTSSTTSTMNTATSATTSTSTNPEQTGYIKHSDNEFNYSLEYPANWEMRVMEDKEIAHLLAIYCLVKSESFLNKQSGTSITLEVRIDRCYAHEEQVSGYLAQDLEFPGLFHRIILERNTVQVDGITTSQVIYQTGPLIQYQKNIWVSVTKGEWEYVITYSAPSEAAFNASLNEFNRFLNTFKAGWII